MSRITLSEKVVEGSKWQSSKYEAPTSKDKKIESEVIVKSKEQGLLGRCIIGLFDKNNAEKPTLSDVRQWSTTVWKKAFGVYIYEMLGGHYLFKFPNRCMAKQILQGEWIWKRNKIKLEWWNPYVGCEPTTYKPKSTWIRVMGLPMHLWTDETFKEIGELYGGWLKTEEETELRNHLKWARIKIRGDGRSIRSEVSISRDGIKFIISIWVERKTLFEFPPESNRTTTREDERKIQQIIDLQSSISEKAEMQVVNLDVTKGNHVEAAVQIFIKPKVARARHVQIFKNKDLDIAMELEGKHQIYRILRGPSQEKKDLKKENKRKSPVYPLTKGLNEQGKRRVVQNLLQDWKADIVCLQETKLEGNVRDLVKQIWAGRWIKYACLEASGTRGGILMLWDS
ncbi:hypothetical protein RDI58_007148 [Solanum bulbocastanum]|uniref:DUF4283 domain-containing protein n=1 Tax=Solanum bulbocastanum TaxID=147425 RepID=A0AAN8TUN8_SOLBU